MTHKPVMTVADLMKFLSRLPPEMPVAVYGQGLYEGGTIPATAIWTGEIGVGGGEWFSDPEDAPEGATRIEVVRIS